MLCGNNSNLWIVIILIILFGCGGFGCSNGCGNMGCGNTGCGNDCGCGC